MAFTSIEGIISAVNSGDGWDWSDAQTASQTFTTAGWYNVTARLGNANHAPLTYTGFVNGGAWGAVMNAATAGAIPVPYAGTSERVLYAMGANATAVAGFASAMLVDILWSGGPISIASNTTVTPTGSAPTLTRYNGSAAERTGNMIMVDVGTAFSGTTMPTIQVNFTKEDGVTTQNATTLTGLSTAQATANKCLMHGNSLGAPFIHLAGAAGAVAVNSVTFASGSAATGTVYLNIVRPLAIIPIPLANTQMERSMYTTLDAVVRLVKGSDSQHGCLAMLALGNGTSGGQLQYSLRTAKG